MGKVPRLNIQKLADGSEVVHDVGEHLNGNPDNFFSHTFSSHLTSEELLKVLGRLGQDLWIFASLIHLLLPISQGCYKITLFPDKGHSSSLLSAI